MSCCKTCVEVEVALYMNSLDFYFSFDIFIKLIFQNYNFNISKIVKYYCSARNYLNPISLCRYYDIIGLILYPFPKLGKQMISTATINTT